MTKRKTSEEVQHMDAFGEYMEVVGGQYLQRREMEENVWPREEESRRINKYFGIN